MSRPLVACVVGTRPEAIKMAPVVLALRERDDVETRLISTGQHREMLAQALAAFDLEPDDDLAIMRHGQTLAEVTARALEGVDRLLETRRPALVLAQGDTTTVFAAALASFYRQVPFGHVEAGLRTDRIDNPFPEEFNRRAAGLVTALHFAPTQWAADNLRREGHADASIVVTGNTGVDAVLQTADRLEQSWFPDHPGRVVLLTTHRRENWGEPQRQVALAARALVERHPDLLLAVPMHANPQVRETLRGVLDGVPRVHLMDPPSYAPFVKLMQRAHLILTDSGGVQEEAPAFGIPVLVLRETTERPEGVSAGNARLVGTDRGAVESAAEQLLSDSAAYAAMATARSPYGDGKAAPRVAAAVRRFLGLPTEEVAPWT